MSKLLRAAAWLTVSLGVVGLLAAVGVFAYLMPRLPSIERLQDVQLQVPLRVYTRDQRLIGEFGEKRRVPLTLEQIPRTMIEATIAAEDEHFYRHPGVDIEGLARAVWHLVRTGEKGPGGSTITMQVARNFFLGREKTYIRKLNEILLALKIERELSKERILELYFNKIFLGQRAYGVGAAAEVYYGRPLERLELHEIAMIAGLPKAPSRFNPVVDPERALTRRNYVLGRMRDLGFIDEAQHQAALAAPVTARYHGLSPEVHAPYVAEMARAFVEERFGEQAYTEGFRVYTTVDGRLQELANRAAREALVEYSERHGYRGPEAQVAEPPADPEGLDEVLARFQTLGGLRPALVVEVGDKELTAYARELGRVRIGWDGLAWAREYLSPDRRGAAPENAADVAAAGDVIRIREGEDGWRLTQVPVVEGALVSLDPSSGAIRALVGGFDYDRSKFNRAVQAERQPGSAFKPFVYSAALERGFTAASFINDAPVVFDDPSLEAAWRPENYSGKFFGPTRLREALYKSRNLVSIRLLRAVGIEFAVDYLQRFGLEHQRLPRNLSLALGSGTVTPLELARGYAVFANGGFRVDPYFIERVVESDGTMALEAKPALACECDGRPAARAAAEPSGADAGAPAPPPFRAAPRVLTAQNAWLMNSLLRDVVRRGTGRRAMQLGRGDLAGKTGTTNDQRDAWFSGFNPSLVSTAWVGFDQINPLGRRETGARAALPMWMKFMGGALEGRPERLLEQPEGLVTVRIDPETGALAGAGDPDAIFETFRADQVPRQLAEAPAAPEPATEQSGEGVTQQLF